MKTHYEFPESYLGNTLETISKLIATRHVRGVDVDTFYIDRNGFDTHTDVEGLLNELFSEVNDALDVFSQEMKHKYIWNNVTVIQTSDFGRTLNPNGNDGTDHAWGGNYFMMGGSVKGRKVLGQYPDNLTDDGPLTLGRGRMIPTTPWEAPFRGIASWLGIKESDMDEVCPNLHNFNSSHLIEFDEMFGEVLVPSIPSMVPSNSPSFVPSSSMTSYSPSIEASISPTSSPSKLPTNLPTEKAVFDPSMSPSIGPSVEPEQECIDSSIKFEVTRPNGTKHFKFCSWVQAKNTITRCLFGGVSKNCPKTCGTCYSVSPTIQPSLQPSPPLRECIDSSLRFKTKLPNKKSIWRNCKWVKAKKIKRCAFQGVSTHCAKTCGTCNICQDSALKIRFRKDGVLVTSKCQWHHTEDQNLCDVIDGFEDACRKSCNKCWTTGQM